MTRDELSAEAGNRSGVYAVVCTEGKRKGWRYVGQAGDLAERLQGHGANRQKYFFANCHHKHPDAFDWSVLVYCPVAALDELESFFIARWETNKSRGGNGFNLTDGGSGRRGYSLSAESKAKISKAGKGRKHTAEHRANISKSCMGRPGLTPSAETRAKLSAAKMGHVKSAETRAKLSKAGKGRKVSAETRANMSAAKKGRKHTAEARANMSKAQMGNKKTLGHKHTAATKAKIRAAVEAYWARLGVAQRRRSPPTAETRAKISKARKAAWARRDGVSRESVSL